MSKTDAKIKPAAKSCASFSKLSEHLDEDDQEMQNLKADVKDNSCNLGQDEDDLSEQEGNTDYVTNVNT